MAIQLKSHAEQMADALRAEILTGKWGRELPGVLAIESEFGVNRNMIQQSLKLLENEGILVPQGRGKPRRIVHPGGQRTQSLRIGIMRYEREDLEKTEVLAETKFRLEEAGHSVAVAPGGLAGMGMDVRRVARAVGKCDVDCWLVVSATHSLLEWFSSCGVPTLSFFGNFERVNIAAISPDVYSLYSMLLKRLLTLGHRRIVFLSRGTTPTLLARELRSDVSQRGVLARALHAHGIAYGPYNRPSFGNAPDKFHQCLDRIFEVTPPTAIYVDEPFLALLTYQHLLMRGCRVPEDVTLVCNESSLAFEWSRPVISHFRWDTQAMVRRVEDWVDHVARGVPDLRQVQTAVEFVEGGTIARARR